MTIDKAKSVINELKLYVEDLHSYSADDVSETLKFVIKALEQQPCDDCISREDAKNLFWNGTEGYDCRGFTRMEIGEMLDDLPSVTSSRPICGADMRGETE